MKVAIEINADQMDHVTKLTLMHAFDLAVASDPRDEIVQHLRAVIKYFTTAAEFDEWLKNP